MRFLFYSCFLFLILSCQGASQYDGHWHMINVPKNLENIETLLDQRWKNKVEYIVLDLKEGQGYWNKNSGLRGHTPTVQLEENDSKLVRNTAACNLGIYNIALKDSVLYLNNDLDQPVYIGYKCSESCCDKQEDFYSDKNIIIDLPIAIDTTQSVPRPVKLSLLHTFYIGNVKQLLDIGYGSPTPRISSGYQYIALKDLPLQIEKFSIKVPENYRNKIIYSIAADKSVPTEMIKDLSAALHENSVNEIYIDIRANTDLHANFKLRHIPYTPEKFAQMPS